MKRLLPAIVLCALMAANASAGDKPAADKSTGVSQPQPVHDLRYGAALFSYYSEDYLDALTELLVAQQRGGITQQGDMPLLMDGSISLSYGMDRRAEAIFNQVLARNVSSDVMGQAWFYLGKVNFARGQYPHAQQLFDKSAQLSGEPAMAQDKVAEREYLSALIAQRGGNLGKAQQLADSIELPLWRQYAQYNLALAQYLAKQPDAAITTLGRLKNLDGDDAEILALNERVVMTRGYVLLQQKKFDDALEQYRSLSLQSPWADRGLLGYGWAALGKGDAALAMQAWQKLVAMPVASASVQEGLLAIPYGFETAGNKTQAVKAYENAADRYEEERKRLHTMRENLTADALLAWVKPDGRSDDSNWLARGNAMALDPVNVTLADLVADTVFQSAVRDLTDLQQLRSHLEEWQKKMPVFGYMLDARRIARDQQLKVIAAERGKFDVAPLQARRDRLAAMLDRAVKSRDPWPLADETLQSSFARWSKAQQIAEHLGNDAETQAAREKLRRIGGVLRWNALEQMNESVWDAQKELKALDSALAEMRERKANLEQLTQRADQIEAYVTRVKSAQVRVDTQLASVKALEARAAARLVTLAGNALQQQEQRVTQYLAYSRLAVARLYDEFYLQQTAPKESRQ